MAIKISAIKPTTLKSVLSASATSISLKQFETRDSEKVSWAQLATDWLVVVVKQGDIWEQIKCDGLTQNVDGSATLNVMANGRHILPIPPYSGSTEGFDFSLGEVAVANDILTVNSIVPDAVETLITDGDAVLDARIDVVQAELDDDVVHNTGDESIAGVKTFTSPPIVPTPASGTDVANKAYVLSQVFGAIYSGFNSANVTYDSDGRVSTVEDPDISKTFTLAYNVNDDIQTISDGTTVWTLNYNDLEELTSITNT